MDKADWDNLMRFARRAATTRRARVKVYGVREAWRGEGKGRWEYRLECPQWCACRGGK